MFREGLRPPDPFRERPPLEAAQTQDGMSLATLSGLSPVLVLCLPALDTRACGAWLGALAEHRRALEENGLRIVLVHSGTDGDARRRLEPHDLHYVSRIADPDRRLYEAFELGEVRRGLWGRTQAPGVFLVQDGEVRRAVRTGKASPPPDLASFG